MSLEGKYYQMCSAHWEADSATFSLRLLPQCEVYRGHFPGRPVCPGACNIEVLRACFTHWMGRKQYIGAIKQCRMLAVLTPDIDADIEVQIKLLGETAGGYQISATLSAAGTTYLEFKGEMLRELA